MSSLPGTRSTRRLTKLVVRWTWRFALCCRDDGAAARYRQTEAAWLPGRLELPIETRWGLAEFVGGKESRP
jgi:hypothetical protein